MKIRESYDNLGLKIFSGMGPWPKCQRRLKNFCNPPPINSTPPPHPKKIIEDFRKMSGVLTTWIFLFEHAKSEWES